MTTQISWNRAVIQYRWPEQLMLRCGGRYRKTRDSSTRSHLKCQLTTGQYLMARNNPSSTGKESTWSAKLLLWQRWWQPTQFWKFANSTDWNLMQSGLRFVALAPISEEHQQNWDKVIAYLLNSLCTAWCYRQATTLLLFWLNILGSFCLRKRVMVIKKWPKYGATSSTIIHTSSSTSWNRWTTMRQRSKW